MTAYLPRATALARLSLLFARVERVTKHEDGVRPETDADHTVMLGIIACDLLYYLREHGPLECGFDAGLVAQFALVHDLAEAYAGDTQTLTITTDGRRDKATREAAARVRLVEEFGADAWMCRVLEKYERQDTWEAQFVRVLDKVLPKLLHTMNACAAAKTLTDYRGFVEAHQRQLAVLRAEYPWSYMTPVFDLLAASMVEAEAAWTGGAS